MDDQVVLEIADLHQERYRLISKAKLIEISKEPDLKKRNARVWEASMEWRISSSNEVDFCLVLNGTEDEESWAELFDE